jgi:hypothetical protein
LIDEREFTTEVAALQFADYWQDEGYKVRITEVV